MVSTRVAFLAAVVAALFVVISAEFIPLPSQVPSAVKNTLKKIEDAEKAASKKCGRKKGKKGCLALKVTNPLEKNMRQTACIWENKKCQVQVDIFLPALCKSGFTNECLDFIFACSTYDGKKFMCGKTDYCAYSMKNNKCLAKSDVTPKTETPTLSPTALSADEQLKAARALWQKEKEALITMYEDQLESLKKTCGTITGPPTEPNDPMTDPPTKPNDPKTDPPTKPNGPKACSSFKKMSDCKAAGCKWTFTLGRFKCKPGPANTDPPTKPNDPKTDPPTKPNDPKTDPPTKPNDPKTDPPTKPNDPKTDPPTKPNDPKTDPPTKPEEPKEPTDAPTPPLEIPFEEFGTFDAFIESAMSNGDGEYAYTAGHIRPLAALDEYFHDTATILADSDHPLSVNVVGSDAAISGTLAINVSAIGITIPFSDNTLEGIAELPFETPSCDVSNPCIDTALAEIDTAEFPFPFGNISDITIGVSGTGKTDVAIPGLADPQDLIPGFSLLFAAPSPLPVCDSDLVFSFELTGHKTYGGQVLCPMDFVFLNGTFPGLHFARLGGVLLGFDVDYHTVSVTIEIGAELQFATGPEESCSEGSTSSQCLTADISFHVGFLIGTLMADQYGDDGFIMGGDFQMSGFWKEPLGLRNFGIVNPYFGMDVFFTLATIGVDKAVAAGGAAAGSASDAAKSWWNGGDTPDADDAPDGDTPEDEKKKLFKPKRMEFGMTLFWKRPDVDDWPEELYDFTMWPAPMEAPPLPTSDYFTVDFDYYFEDRPHDVPDLESLFMPKYGMKLLVTQVSLTDILYMLSDIVGSFSSGNGNGTNYDFSFIEKFITMEFFLDAQLAFHPNEKLTPALGGAPGIFVNCTASLAAMFGLDFDMRILAYTLFEFAEKAEAMEELKASVSNASNMREGWNALTTGLNEVFFKDPLGFLNETGFDIQADLILPFELGEAHFTGILNSTLFKIEATAELQIFNFQLADVAIMASYDKTTPGSFQLGLHAEFGLPLIGTAEMGGYVNRTYLELYGGIDAAIFGLRFCATLEVMVDSPDWKEEDDYGCTTTATLDGREYELQIPCSDCTKVKTINGVDVEVPVPCFYVEFNSHVSFGVLGDATFLGRVENSGVLANGTLDNNVDDAIEAIVKDAIEAIFGESDSWFVDGFSAFIGDLLSSALLIDKMEFTLDTRSTPKFLKMTLHFNLAGITVKLPEITINWGNKDRRRRALTARRKYRRSEAYEAAHGTDPLLRRAMKNRHLRRLTALGIDCTEDNDGISFEDFVDAIADAVDFLTMAAKLHICMPGVVKDRQENETCASDGQCANSDVYPDGLWCDRDGKVSAGFTCAGTCKKRYDGGAAVPWERDAACKSGTERCGMCSEIGTDQVPHGSVCGNDDACANGYCKGKGLPCSGICTPFVEDGGDCAYEMDYNCVSGKCRCAQCANSGSKKLANGLRCGNNGMCESGWCKDGKPCTSRTTGGVCTEKLDDGQNCAYGMDSSCKSGKCKCAVCANSAGKLPNYKRCANDGMCQSGWCENGKPCSSRTTGGTCKPQKSKGSSCKIGMHNSCAGSLRCKCGIKGCKCK